MPLIQYFRKQSLVQLTGFFVLVDSLVMEQDFGYGRNLIPRMQKNMMEGKRDMVNLLVEQIMFCSHLFLTKGDRIKKNKLNEIAGHIEKINPLSHSYSIIHGKLPIESLLEIEEYKYSNVEKLFKELQPILYSRRVSFFSMGKSPKVSKLVRISEFDSSFPYYGSRSYEPHVNELKKDEVILYKSTAKSFGLNLGYLS